MSDRKTLTPEDLRVTGAPAGTRFGTSPRC